MNRHTTEQIGELLEKIRILEEKVYRDSLTGSYNRRFYDEMLFCTQWQPAMSGPCDVYHGRRKKIQAD